MSIRALVKGVETRLRSAAVFNDQPEQAIGKYIGVMPAPGKPRPNFGQWFAAVHWDGGRGADKGPMSHDVYHGIVVTLTARLNYAPKDRQGNRLVTADDVYDLVDQIAGRGVIHGSTEVLAAANALIPGTSEYLTAEGQDPAGATVNGFIELLVLDTFGPERPVDGEWIGATETKDCFAIDIRFREARRKQSNN